MLGVLTSNWYIFFPLAFSLFVALRLAEGSTDAPGRSWGTAFARLIVATLLGFALLAVGLRSTLLGIMWLLLLGIFAVLLYWKHRQLERSALLLTALQADTEHQQMAACDSFWFENSGWMRRLSGRLRDDLVSGKSWWDTLQQRRAARGVYEVLAVRLASIYGNRRLPATQGRGSEVAAELLKPLQIETETERLLGRLSIVCWLFLALPLIGVILVFVVPSLRAVLAAFGQLGSSRTQLMLSLADSNATWGWAFVLYVVPFFLAMALLPIAWVWFFPYWAQRAPFSWVCGDYFRTAGLAALAQALERERDLVAACRLTSQLIGVDSVAKLYSRAAELLLAGLAPHVAFRQAGLITRREFRAFGGGLDATNPIWSLQQLSRWKMDRMLRRYGIAVQCALVLFTLAVAVVAGSLAIGVFQILIDLITAAD